MEPKDTRQQILNVALRLVSNRGFSDVSIRDICKEVGIKESTVYYHFINKQDVLDNLVEEFTKTIDKLDNLLASSLEGDVSREINDADFIRVGKIYYSQFLNEDRIFKFISMLMIEQKSNPDFGKLLSKVMFEQPLEIQSKHFSVLIQGGFLKSLPVYELAFAYQSIFYFCFSHQIASGQSVQQAEAELERHLSFFLNQYGRTPK